MVALKLKDEDDKPLSPDSYKKNDLVTYNEARKSTTPQPYIAAVVTFENETTFILGDGRNTSNPTSRRRRSTSSDYYNGPLEPATSYSIFQRIFINEEVIACNSIIKFKFPLLCLHEIKVNAKNPSSLFHQRVSFTPPTGALHHQQQVRKRHQRQQGEVNILSEQSTEIYHAFYVSVLVLCIEQSQQEQETGR